MESRRPRLRLVPALALLGLLWGGSHSLRKRTQSPEENLETVDVALIGSAKR